VKKLQVLLLILIVGFSSSCTDASLRKKVSELQAIEDSYNAERATTKKNMDTFDELDLVAFNKRDIKRIQEIHADDVTVYNPGGSITKGMDPHHTEELKFLFDTFDFVVKEHIVGFGFDDWTAGISICTGKWVKPIKLPNGKTLKPTGKSLEIKIATIARWKDGRIAEEYLFWDNDSWNKQIGMK
jgi:ketosteroid isomerase-like protein